MDERRQFLPTSRKIADLEAAKRRAAAWRSEKKAVAYTNGCFDLLHLGHVRTLESARRQADVLVVGINGDESVRQLKGPGRPVLPEQDRAETVAALECVDLVVVFQELSSLPVIQALKPEVWVKGGDYRIDTVNQEERAYVESYGGRVALAEHVPHVSSSDLIAQLRRLGEAGRQ
jgi:D-beta-D-heptose 7-phosphate kinase/D-beta-D-heptose 1-phosphate adenosyltransferase